MESQHLFRSSDGKSIKSILNEAEGISYKESPLDFFILLARYKFASRFVKRDQTVLDAGCGHGLGSVFLSKVAKEVHGADFDEEMVRYNRQAHADVPNLSFRTLNLAEPLHDPQPYDVVVSMDVIEHFDKDTTYIVAQNYAKLTKDSGFAVIGTPNIASQPYASARRKATHIHEFEPKEFEETLRTAFKNVFLFSMTDEVVSTSFNKMAWYLMAICTK